MQSFARIRSAVSDAFRMVKMNFPFNQEMNVLNEKCPEGDDKPHQHATAVSAALHKMILRLKGKYLSGDGKSVDYARLKADDLFKDFQNLANQLATVKLDELNPTQRKAFFINTYNTLTIHGLCNCDSLPKSVTDVTRFWKRTAYTIDGLTFSLDDIEHGILRANTRHPSEISRPFSDSDPRLKYTMEELDCRIHFALNCGAKSCPAIGAYDETNLEAALTGAAITFLEGTVRVEGNHIRLSKILSWYGADFGSDETHILRWIGQYLPAELEEQVGQLTRSGHFCVVYDDYDWQLNAR